MKRKHRSFWMDVDGEPVHVTGDPNMSAASRDALAELVRVVRSMTPEEWRQAAERGRRRHGR